MLGRGAQVLVDRLATDAELAGQCGFGGAELALWTNCETCASLKDLLRPRYAPRFLARSMPSRWRSRIKARSNSAKAPITDRRSVAIAVSSPVKVSCSLTNWTRTPLAVSWRTMLRRSSRFRASRSIECTITVSPSRTKLSMAPSAGAARLCRTHCR